MYNISLPISNKKIYWQNYGRLLLVARLQTGPQHWREINTLELSLQKLQNLAHWNWNRTSKHINVDNLKRVIDVGCGIATFDLTLHHLNKDIEFFLVDKTTVEYPKQPTYYSQEYYSYNLWEVFNDSLNSPEVDKSKFNILSPNDEWPDDVDLVISMFSWCWHYPKDYYWTKLVKSLKIGGTLILEVLNVKDRNIIEEISDELGSKPNYDLKYPPADHPYIDHFNLIDGSHGGYYSWIRAR